MLPIDEIAKEVDPRFGNSAITDGPKTFLYLFRRFGPSRHGSDAYKSVCQYYIPLSVDGTYLGVTITGEAAYWGFAAVKSISSGLETALRAGGGELVERCIAAAKEGLRDLIRPVAVRDSSFTIFGEANNDDCTNSFAEYAPSSGFGVPREFLMHTELFLDFMDWVRKQAGNGDTALAMRELMMDGEHNDSDG